MLWRRRNLTILLLICSSIVCSTESRYRDKVWRRGNNSRNDKNNVYSSSSSSSSSSYTAGGSVMTSTTQQVNICSRERDMKLLCYCSPDPQDFKSPIPVTKADCWIFHKDFYQNDTIWQGFHQRKSLRHLKFTVQSTGYLDYIPSKYLEVLSNLSTLSIEYAQIVIVKGYAFGNLSNLDLLTLTNNAIEIIDKDAFSNHVQLKELNLMRNQITEIDRYAFNNLPTLEKLYLSWNNLTSLHEDVFSDLGKLDELRLDENLISVLTRDTFKGLGNLKTLKLSHNNLNFIGDTVFAELWSLQELELDDNRIERISERAFDGLNNLKTLNLRYNKLKKLDNGVLRGVPALLSINLQDNLLETLTYYNVQPVMDNLVNNNSELSVSDNRFVCDCRLAWVFDLRNRTRNMNLRNSLEEIECILFAKTPTSLQRSRNEIVLNTITGDHQPAITNTQQSHPIIASHGGIDYNGNNHHSIGLPSDFENEYYEDDAPFEFAGAGSVINAGPRNVINRNSNAGKSSTIGTSGSNIHSVDSSNFIAISNSPDNGIGTSSEIHNNRNGEVGRIVELFKLTAAKLPCPEELTDPTELPLSRESIGMDVRGTHQSTNSINKLKSNSLNVALSFILLIILELTSLLSSHFNLAS